MAAYGVHLVIDVGANSGQYASGLRAAGYAGRIVSFEPLSEPHGRLAAASSRDADWDCRQLALGRRPGTRTINVSDRPYLKMDTQGSELDVLLGAMRILDAMSLIEVELSLLPVYDSAPIFGDVHGLLARHGFAPIAFEGVLDDTETGEMLQADGIFRRVDRIDPGRD
jgi:hypothetical protein